MDLKTQKKWDRAAPNFDLMAGLGAEKRWEPHKRELFSQMEGRVLFLALGTGLDIPFFPSGQKITAIDISPKMLEQAEARIQDYDGNIEASVMDVHELSFEDNAFDQVFTSCTFCSVPDPINGLKSIARVLRPGGKLLMFEHTGSQYHPFRLMMNMMTVLTSRIGPDMNRPTVENVEAAGFDLEAVNHVFLDVVKTIEATKPLA